MSQSNRLETKHFPLLPLRRGVVFPGTIITLPVGRARSRALIESLEAGTSIIGVGVQKDTRVKNPTVNDLHHIGTLAKVVRIRRNGERMFMVTLEGLHRFELLNIVRNEPFWLAEVVQLQDEDINGRETKLLAEVLRDELSTADPEGAGALARLAGASRGVDNPGILADRVASALELDGEQQVKVLLSLHAGQRLRLVTQLIGESMASAEIKKRLESEVRKAMSKDQREAVLRQQLRAIQKELGHTAGQESDALRERLEAKVLPQEVREVVDKQLARMGSLNPAQPEYNVIRNYLDLIAELPWEESADVQEDLEALEAKLEADHYGLKDVKQRILEHMAVLKVTGSTRGTILCLAGPPGVGKTSIAQSIADATGRPLVRIALGGVRDEAEIRGHRRTYVGALPGRIIHGMKKVGVNNPVILLDEIDKLAQGWSGNPEAALLEVLDPEQNHQFQDHYLEVPYDLSKAVFVCTANRLDTISAPLRDRLEIVELTGYTRDEKLLIAQNHLLPKQLERHGLVDDSVSISDAALMAIIHGYTREAGVRQLDRQMARICRGLTLEVARRSEEAEPVTFHIGENDLNHYLGKLKFLSEIKERTSIPGVATGLAWTPVGGDVLFVETSKMPGKGRLEITGKLGDVMKESARAALTYVRSHADLLDVDPEFLENLDLHIHVPAGAVPKDGPSAGVTMFTALTSLLTGRRVRPDTAMTGECTLRGRVLPVGGIKSKVLAAHRRGLTRVILPKMNERDLAEIPDNIRDELEFILAEDMSEVLNAALESDGEGGVDAPMPTTTEHGGSGAAVEARPKSV